MSIDLTKMPKLGFGLMRLPEADGKIDITAETLRKPLRKLSLKDTTARISISPPSFPHGA